jgi:hypothetical protein
VKYYNLMGKNTLVIRVDDERTAEFSAKNPVRKMVDDYEKSFRGSYTVENLKAAFPQMKEIKRVPYAKSVDTINDYNAKQSVAEKKLDGVPLADMNRYISMFPAENPNIISYEDLNKIRFMMYAASRSMDSYLAEPSPETIISLTKGLYGLLQDAKEKNNKKYINAILRAGKDLNPKDYGFSVGDVSEEGGDRGQRPTRRANSANQKNG